MLSRYRIGINPSTFQIPMLRSQKTGTMIWTENGNLP